MNRKTEHTGQDSDQGKRPDAESARAREADDLRVEELEERIMPKLASNHNETLLVLR